MKRRFIAGAVCPQCRALDRIVLETGGAESRRCCIECDFSEVLDDSPELAGNSGSSLPPSRLLRPSSISDVESSPVRLIDPKKLPKKS